VVTRRGDNPQSVWLSYLCQRTTIEMIRNVFDQYEQPENKLTHALMVTLSNDRKLIKPFLKLVGAKNVPSLKDIELGVQCAPGQEAVSAKDGQEGLPDGCFFSQEGWAVILEAKVQAKPSGSQLKRHLRVSRRYGYDKPHVVLVSVDEPKRLPSWVKCIAWKDVYSWFNIRADQSSWAYHFVEYMRIFESKMLAIDYSIRGTLTMFDGFRFNDKEPYTYSEGKRLIKLLGVELRKRKELVKTLGIDRTAPGRGAITRGEAGAVWDYLPLKICKGRSFTSTVHPTLVIRPAEVGIALTIPNAMKGVRSTLKDCGMEGFECMLSKVEKGLRPILAKAPMAKPMIYIVQRHYKSQRSRPTEDGRIEADLRIVVGRAKGSVKNQPCWLQAFYELLVNKKTNMQWGIQLHIPHTEKVMRMKKAVDHMAKSWMAMKPLMDFVL